MSPGTLTLRLLGNDFSVESDDERMLAFVGELWSPFVAGPAADAVAVVLEAEPGRWRLRIGDEPVGAAVDPWVFAGVLRNELTRRAIAAATSIVPLHGAAVESDGLYLVLAGPPRTGKTTLLLELLDSGRRLVTDDLVPIDPSDLTATPFPKPLSVREPDRWRRFAGRWERPAWLPEPAGAGLIPAPAFALVEERPFRPGALVFPVFEGGSDAVWEELTPARTVAACGANVHPAGDRGPRTLGVLARLGAATPGYVLRYGSSEEAMELLEKGLAGSQAME